MGATPVYALPYPEPGDPADVPTDMHELADRIETIIVPGSASGQVPVWDNTAKKWSPAGGAVLLADTLLAAPAASIDLPNIPQTYRHLLLELQARHDASGTFDYAYCRFNGDATASYDYQEIRNTSASAVAGAEGLAQTWLRFGFVAGLAAIAAKAGIGELLVPNYVQATFHKNSVARGQFANAATGTQTVGQWGGTWRNVGPINRLTVYPGVGNFIAGTRVSILALT